KAGVVPVEVRRIVAAVADEKLRAAGIATAVSHRKYAPIVVLVVAIQFTFDGIPRSAGTGARGVASLDDEIGDDPVKRYAIVVARRGQLPEVGKCDRVGCFVKSEGEVGFFGLDNCFTQLFKLGPQTMESRPIGTSN